MRQLFNFTNFMNENDEDGCHDFQFKEIDISFSQCSNVNIEIHSVKEEYDINC